MNSLVSLRRGSGLISMKRSKESDLPFRVELWDDKDSRIEEVIALTSDFASAKGAVIKERTNLMAQQRKRIGPLDTAGSVAVENAKVYKELRRGRIEVQ